MDVADIGRTNMKNGHKSYRKVYFRGLTQRAGKINDRKSNKEEENAFSTPEILI